MGKIMALLIIAAPVVQGLISARWSDSIKRCWQFLPEHHTVSTALRRKSSLLFDSMCGNIYELVRPHCYLSNQYRVGFSLLNGKKSLILEMIQR